MIRALVVRRVLYRNGLGDLRTVKELRLEPLRYKLLKDQPDDKKSNYQQDPLFHCLRTRKNESLSL